MYRSLLLFVLFNFLYFNLFSQVQIGMAEMPDKDSEILYSFAKTDSKADHTIKGNAVSWDYSSLEYELQLKEEYKSAGSINFFFFGIKNGFGTKTADSLGAGQLMMRDIYDVFKTTSGKMTAEGRSLNYNGVPVPQFYSDKDEIYQFPLKYGRKDVSTFKVALSLGNQFTMIQSGSRVNEVEGEGSLKTPFKSYSSVIKIKTVIDQIDSLKISILPFIPIPRKFIEYKWFAPGVVGPVLIVKGSELLGRFTVQEIKFQDKPISLIGFEADKNVANINQVVILSDTSSITAQGRTWVISPNTFQYVSGTNSGSKNPELVFTAMGAYNVELLVRNRFGQMTESRRNYIQILESTSLEDELSKNFELVVFPNPVSSYLYFKSQVEIENVEIVNMCGKTQPIEIKANAIDVSNFPAGNYLLKVEAGENVFYKKFEKRN